MAIPGILDLSRDVDQIRKYVAEKMAANAFSSDSPLNTASLPGVPSPTDYLNYFKLIGDKLATEDGLFFLAKQTLLKSMNPTFGMGKLYNPASALGPPPYAGGMFTDFLEAPAAAMNPGERIAREQDRLLALAQGRYNDTSRLGTMDASIQVNAFKYDDGKTIQQKISENNLFDSENTATNNEYVGVHNVTKHGITFEAPDFEKIFETRRAHGPAFLNEERGSDFFKPKIDSRVKISEEKVGLQRSFEDQDTFMSDLGYSAGFEDEMLDSALYVPFYFQDLRKEERRIHFRAFLNQFSEKIQPKWQQEEYFGRIDPVANYKNTHRTISLSFKIMPSSPAGFTAAWRKINNFAKMCYPTKSRAGSLIRSPIIRMRVGDVIADAAGLGLPGYIDSLDLNYTDSVWETSDFQPESSSNVELGKAPMKIEVSMSFVVIHERNPANDEDYNFDFDIFRRIGRPPVDQILLNSAEEDVESPDSELSDAPVSPPETIV